MAEQIHKIDPLWTDEARVHEATLLFIEKNPKWLEYGESAEVIGAAFSSGEGVSIQFNHGVMEHLQIQRPCRASVTDQPLACKWVFDFTDAEKTKVISTTQEKSGALRTFVEPTRGLKSSDVDLIANSLQNMRIVSIGSKREVSGLQQAEAKKKPRWQRFFEILGGYCLYGPRPNQ